MPQTKEEIHSQALANLHTISTRMEGLSPWHSAMQVAVSHKTQIAKFQNLKQIATKISEIGAPLTACKNGCSYCCYQAVSVSELEARDISKLTGRRYVKPQVTDIKEDRQRFAGVPCVFLEKGQCSIYEARPLICRTHLNLSNNKDICKIGDPLSHDVPYLDTSPLNLPITLICGGEFHDIRYWFPKDCAN